MRCASVRPAGADVKRIRPVASPLMVGGGERHAKAKGVQGMATDFSDTPVSCDVPASQRTGDLVDLYYTELKRLARLRLAGENVGHSLHATGLLHEAVLRLFATGRSAWHSRSHFFTVVSEEMRRIIVDAARARRALKRGNASRRVDFDPDWFGADDRAGEILLVDDLLDRLATVSQDAADVVRLRYFGGLEMTEIASAVGISERSAYRRFCFARAWIAKHLGESAA